MNRVILTSVLCLSFVAAVVTAAPLYLPAGSSPLADAAQRSDIQSVRAMLKEGAEVNAPQGDGMTALHWAAFKGDAPLTEMLIYAGANLRAATRIGAYTPLMVAAKAGQAKIVDLLLKAGADVTLTTTTGITPLMLAAASGSVEATRLLLDNGANANARENSYGQTALMLAAGLSRNDVIKLLVERGADPRIASTVRELKGQDRAAQTAGQNANQNQQAGRTQAQIPQQNTFKDGLRTLLRDTTQKTEYAMGGMSPLHYAARDGQLAAVLALLDAGADINERSPADDTTPLLIAATNGQFDTALRLLERGADPNLTNAIGTTPLYATLNIQWAPRAEYPKPTPARQKTGYLELIKALLDHGADANVRLKQAVWWSNYSIQNTGLSEAGATPFWRAAQSSDIEAMRLLITSGADPTIPNSQGVTPLNAAAGGAWNGNYNVNSPAGWMPAVKYLVDELGLDVNTPDDSGSTPLHAAAWRGDNELILYLVSKGGDVTVVNKNGQTVADMANGPVQRLQPFPETIKLLVKLGSKNNNRCVSC